jgi:hypothetical protein
MASKKEGKINERKMDEGEVSEMKEEEDEQI